MPVLRPHPAGAGRQGIDHERVEIDLSSKPPWLREMNPRNRVPVIRDEDAILWESEALNEYLEEIHPDPAMMPDDAVGRARVRGLMRRFEDLSDAYYAARRGEDGAIEAFLEELEWVEDLLRRSPTWPATSTRWPSRAAGPGSCGPANRHRPGRYPALVAWCERLAQRPSTRRS